MVYHEFVLISSIILDLCPEKGLEEISQNTPTQYVDCKLNYI
jgi:hypothetical protein